MPEYRKNLLQLTTQEMPVMVSISDAVKYSGIPNETLRCWCVAGRIPAIRSGRKWYINWNGLLNYLNGGNKDE